jgi:hypothetical protein
MAVAMEARMLTFGYWYRLTDSSDDVLCVVELDGEHERYRMEETTRNSK